MKLYKTKEKEVFYYYLKNGEKRFMYRHLYYDILGNRREKSKSSFKTEVEATRELLKLKVDLIDNGQLQVNYDDITVGQWFKIWYETYNDQWSVSTRYQRKLIIENHLPPIAHFQLKKLTKTMFMNHFIKPLQKKLQPSTLRNYYTIFKIGINAAVDEEIIPRNRFGNIKIEKDKSKENYLTPENLNIFLKYAKEEDMTGFVGLLILAYTGMRKGEVNALTWDCICFDEETITIEETRDDFGTRKPKTSNSYRTIKVDKLLIMQLKKYKYWCRELKFKYGMKLSDHDNVLISPYSGKKIDSSYLNRCIKQIYGKMKSNKLKINEITPHGLRHTHCTILINNNIPINTIADRLGNTPEMILRIYAHSFDKLEETAVETFANSVKGI